MASFSRTRVEPKTTPEQRYQQLKAEVHRQMVEAVDLSQLNRWSGDRLRREVRALAEQIAAGSHVFGDGERERLVEEVLNEAFGLGPLEELMSDPTINDILVNGPNTVYVERYGRLEQTPITFADNAHLMRVIQRIAARIGRRVDESSPMVDARLPDGSRVNAIVPPLALDGAVLSIRRFGVRFTDVDLLTNQTLASEMLVLLKGAVEGRINLVVSGGTGAGKTTLLNCLSRFIPHDERLVTIEDSAELKLQQPHVVRMETRPPNLEGAGEVTQRQLVRNSLRMRPDRIIIGEVRGPEALDMLQAMNTGHEGSLTTIHANDTRDALARLELMVTMAGFDVPVPIIRNYIASAITLVVHLARLKGGPRKVMRISEIVGRRQRGTYRVQDLFVFRQTGVEAGVAVGAFHATGRVPRFLDRLKDAGIDLPADLFLERVLAAGSPAEPAQARPPETSGAGATEVILTSGESTPTQSPPEGSTVEAPSEPGELNPTPLPEGANGARESEAQSAPGEHCQAVQSAQGSEPGPGEALPEAGLAQSPELTPEPDLPSILPRSPERDQP